MKTQEIHNLVGEIWKDIAGYEKYYKISNFGRIKTLSKIIPYGSNLSLLIPEKILKSDLNIDGYQIVRLSKNGQQKNYRVHILLYKTFIKDYDTKEYDIDHINGIRSDNSLSNLRLATRQQNSFNKGKHKKATSKYKGVYWNKQMKKWKVQIGYNGKRFFLGYYKDEKKAAKIYNKKATELFGEFARLNII